MKLKSKNQDFQAEAVNSVVDLFAVQEDLQSTFEIVQESQFSFYQNDLRTLLN